MEIKSKEEFASKVKEIRETEGYVDPIMFGITRNDMGIIDKSKTLVCNYLTCNVGDNLGSAAIFKYALDTLGDDIIVHKSDNEAVYEVTPEFLEQCVDMFKPYEGDVHGGNHKNIESIYHITALNNELIASEDYIKLGDERFVFRVTFVYDDVPCETVETSYLKLQSLSNGTSPLRTLNLNGIFGLLTNCAFLADGMVVELEVLRVNEMKLKVSANYPIVLYVDKFPRYLQHVIPDDNTRILDTSKVRFGSQLAAGSTIMNAASYVNFNAGTEGPCMVEGRISSSAIVGKDTDIGGGASILGVLSGTAGIPITIGERCLLGANSVTGISLGEGCIVDAGTTILAGTKVTIDSEELALIKEVNPGLKLDIVEGTTIIVKGEDLNNLHGVLYRRDSVTGVMSAYRTLKEITLNKDLH